MEQDLNIKYSSLITYAKNFCVCLENAREADEHEFVEEITGILPVIYVQMFDIDVTAFPETGMFDYMPQYVDEEYYDSIRRNLETLFGSDDTYLETFVEDMKYSDTPVAASIAENLADIFQDLYNFVCAVKESEGMQTATALVACKENFDNYWSQTLCNVMRPLNALRVG